MPTRVCGAHGHTRGVPGCARQGTPELYKHHLATAQSPPVPHGNGVSSQSQKPESTRSFQGSIAVPAVSRITVSDDTIISPGEREEAKL